VLRLKVLLSSRACHCRLSLLLSSAFLIFHELRAMILGDGRPRYAVLLLDVARRNLGSLLHLRVVASSKGAEHVLRALHGVLLEATDVRVGLQACPNASVQAIP
jgi:hypothetical protein